MTADREAAKRKAAYAALRQHTYAETERQRAAGAKRRTDAERTLLQALRALRLVNSAGASDAMANVAGALTALRLTASVNRWQATAANLMLEDRDGTGAALAEFGRVLQSAAGADLMSASETLRPELAQSASGDREALAEAGGALAAVLDTLAQRLSGGEASELQAEASELRKALAASGPCAGADR